MTVEHNQRVARLSRILADEGDKAQAFSAKNAARGARAVAPRGRNQFPRVPPPVSDGVGRWKCPSSRAVRDTKRKPNKVGCVLKGRATERSGCPSARGRSAVQFVRTHNRPYKATSTLDETLQYMESESGKNFDPQWIDMLLQCRAKLEDMYEPEG